VPKFLLFHETGTSASGLTKIWAVMNTAMAELGRVTWYAPWRRYCYTSVPFSVTMDANCMRELADFCELETRQHGATLMRNKTGIKGS
jgi:hypothetical protein